MHPEDIALHAEEMRPKADYSKLDEIDFGDSTEAQEFKRAVKDQNTREIANHEQNIADLTQSAPRYRTRDESFIETVQGPFSAERERRQTVSSPTYYPMPRSLRMMSSCASKTFQPIPST